MDGLDGRTVDDEDKTTIKTYVMSCLIKAHAEGFITTPFMPSDELKHTSATMVGCRSPA